MKYGHWFRRAFHLCAPLFLVYYLMPDDMWGIGISNEVALLLLFIFLMVFEAVRLAKGWVFFGLREYEKGQLSAYAWAAIALTAAFLFFPPVFVAVAVVGMGWTDPLIGELRRHREKLYPLLPMAVYFLIAASCLWLFSDIGLFAIIFLASLTTTVAIVVEHPQLRYVDDDFLMLIVPLVVLTGVYECMAFTGMV